MLSDSWLKVMQPCLVFVIVHIRDKGSLRRRLVMIKTKNDDQEYRLKTVLKNLMVHILILLFTTHVGSSPASISAILCHILLLLFATHVGPASTSIPAILVHILLLLFTNPYRVSYSLHSFYTCVYVCICVCVFVCVYVCVSIGSVSLKILMFWR